MTLHRKDKEEREKEKNNYDLYRNNTFECVGTPKAISCLSRALPLKYKITFQCNMILIKKKN